MNASPEFPLIELRDVAFAYSATRQTPQPPAVLDGINLSVRSGEIVALLGPSGCGKSTLLNLIAGFLTPTRGEVRMNGQPVSCPSPDRAVIFQADALFPWLSVRANVAFGPSCRGDRQRLDQVGEHLAMVGLDGFSAYYPAQLSAGMRQRVELARVLVNHGPALLLDEPFSALDAQTRETMQELVLDVHSRLRPSIVIVTHDAEEAIFLADRVTVMTHSPSRLLEPVAIPLPRPRHEAMRDSEPATKLRRHLRQLLASADRDNQACIRGRG